MLDSSSGNQSGPDFQPDDGWQHLLQDPSFRLLKVQRSAKRIGHWQRKIKSMTVVTPALDPDIAKEVQEKGWFSLSHLWGDPATWIDWDGADVTDATTGEVITARVHPDKSKEIMTLLQFRGGFWWIDLFCARSDTPLVIMGDIYRHCKRCFALIESSCEGFHDELYGAFKLAALMVDRHIHDAAQAYLDRVSARGQSIGESGWNQILRDMLCWSFEHFEDGLFEHFRDLLESSPRMGPLMQLLMGVSAGEREKSALVYFDRHGLDAADEKDHRLFLQQLRTWKVDNLNQSVDAIAKLLKSQWMNRVWTLQEFFLPGIVWPPPPWIRNQGAPTCETFSRFSDLQREFSKLLKVVIEAYTIRAEAIDVPRDQEDAKTRTPRQLLDIYQSKDPVLAHIYSDYRELFEVMISIGQAPGKRTKFAAGSKMEKLILNSFATSRRKALCSIDYVYGVLGLLDIDIPRLADPVEVWRIFSETLQKRHPDISVPSDIDLSKAMEMQDVYGKFGFTNENFYASAIMEFISR